MNVEIRNPISIGVDAPLSQVSRVGNLVFLAGQCSLSPHGDVIGIDDIEAQTTEAIEHMRVIMQDFDADLDGIASVTVYLSNLKRDYAGFNAAYAAAFGDHKPPRTTIEAPLALETLLVEISATGAV